MYLGLSLWRKENAASLVLFLVTVGQLDAKDNVTFPLVFVSVS